jgi:hypothetical protein
MLFKYLDGDFSISRGLTSYSRERNLKAFEKRPENGIVEYVST